MRSTVLKYGFIAGGILAATMLIGLPFHDEIGLDNAEIIGYSTMVAAFLLVFFGIRAYRDGVAGGRVSFGRALQVGLLITSVATACYVATWELIYFKFRPDFGDAYAAHMLEKARADGASEAALAKKREEVARFQEMYKNPIINIAITSLEPLPVALAMTLLSAAFLSRRRREDESLPGLAPSEPRRV